MNKLVRWTGLPLLGVALLAGCTPAASTAAIVNDVAIPDSQISHYANACATAAERTGAAEADLPTANDLRRGLVSWAILGEMSRQYVEANGGGPSDREIAEFVAQQPDMGWMVLDEGCAEVVQSVARHALIAYELGFDVDDYLGEDNYTVQVNPRYGQWDYQELRLQGTGSLSLRAPGVS